jgi:hypothetical protein
MSGIALHTESKAQIISALETLLEELKGTAYAAEAYTLKFTEHPDDFC